MACVSIMDVSQLYGILPRLHVKTTVHKFLRSTSITSEQQARAMAALYSVRDSKRQCDVRLRHQYDLLCDPALVRQMDGGIDIVVQDSQVDSIFNMNSSAPAAQDQTATTPSSRHEHHEGRRYNEGRPEQICTVRTAPASMFVDG